MIARVWHGWTSRVFAVNDYETAVIEPDARALLSRFDERSVHYELVFDDA